MKSIIFEWTADGVFAPLPRFKPLCDRELVVHQLYKLEPVEEVSKEERGFFHACIAECWKSLPEDLAQNYRTPEALRKRALMVAGFRTERTRTFKTEEDAENAAALVRPMDEYAHVEVRGKTVHIFEPMSQARGNMNKKEWQEAKNRVLDVLSRLIKTDVTTLISHTTSPTGDH